MAGAFDGCASRRKAREPRALRGRQKGRKVAWLFQPPPNKFLDASDRSVFCNMTGPAVLD